MPIGEHRGILISLDAVVHFYYEQCDTAPYMAVFAVASTLVYCFDLRPMYDTKKVVRTGGMERNEVRPPVSHVVVYIPCIKHKIWCVLEQYFRGFGAVWKRQEYELVVVIILYVLLRYHKNMYWYV